MKRETQLKLGILLLILILIANTFMIACSPSTYDLGIVSGDSTRFVYTGDSYIIGYEYKVYYDSKTEICYFISTNADASGISVMYDNLGKPMTLEIYNRSKGD